MKRNWNWRCELCFTWGWMNDRKKKFFLKKLKIHTTIIMSYHILTCCDTFLSKCCVRFSCSFLFFVYLYPHAHGCLQQWGRNEFRVFYIPTLKWQFLFYVMSLCYKNTKENWIKCEHVKLNFYYSVIYIILMQVSFII